MNDIQTTNQTKYKSKHKTSTKNLVLTSMFTAILCVMAQISIQTPMIPFTMSLFAIFLIGALLPPRLAMMSVLAYVLLGAFGLPVFAGFKGGLPVVVGMTGGFIMAYPVMSLVTALFYRIVKKHKIVALSIGMLLSLILCYLIGSLWFSYSTGNSFYYALTVCVAPYILFDLIKIVLAISVSTVLRAAITIASE
ncbi:MAG TPA: biotin transporter BioY [Mobilitalea sp.]|nr:biotin transporter BioY [Mobilitalea sp.]